MLRNLCLLLIERFNICTVIKVSAPVRRKRGKKTLKGQFTPKSTNHIYIQSYHVVAAKLFCKRSCCCVVFQDYTQNIHGKEIDLLRVTVKVPGKRPPRAVAPAGPSPVPPVPAPGVNGLSKDPAAADNTSTGTSSSVTDTEGVRGGERFI